MRYQWLDCPYVAVKWLEMYFTVYSTIVMSNLNKTKNRMCKSDSLFIVGKSVVKSYVKVGIGE